MFNEDISFMYLIMIGKIFVFPIISCVYVFDICLICMNYMYVKTSIQTELGDINKRYVKWLIRHDVE